MAEATPNKSAARTSFTPIDRFVLSPFFSQDNQFYLCMSPIQPIAVSYVSPGRNFTIRSRLNEMPIPICENCSSRILSKKVELLKATASTKNKEVDVTKDNPELAREENNSNSVTTDAQSGEKPAKKEIKKNIEETVESKEKRVIRRRKRKNMDQLKLLYNEYKKNPNWNKTTMAEMAQKTGLTEAQVYKWSWDQKRKKLE
eukprot:TRINITY_DN8155_c0_g1_i1.p1 TRINITY_DN8155_c0_g1~~TRINITY_DN8155_c0_g1_i1.p1  ORF type:complete len:201 (+),score=52.05 TRINITY_DN8155_c0_g1_i1:260-862(+)